MMRRNISTPAPEVSASLTRRSAASMFRSTPAAISTASGARAPSETRNDSVRYTAITGIDQETTGRTAPVQLTLFAGVMVAAAAVQADGAALVCAGVAAVAVLAGNIFRPAATLAVLAVPKRNRPSYLRVMVLAGVVATGAGVRGRRSNERRAREATATAAREVLRRVRRWRTCGARRRSATCCSGRAAGSAGSSPPTRRPRSASPG